MKKLISFVLISSMCLSLSLPALAASSNAVDPYSVEGQYVQELVDLTKEEIDALPLAKAEGLFEQAFGVSAKNYSEDEIRLALDGLAFGLKFQVSMNAIKAAEDRVSGNTGGSTRGTTSGKTYSGSVGVAWTRDTTSGNSPLTLGEILSGTYTLEVDYITWATAATILAASGSYNAFSDLALLVSQGATGATLAYYICTALGITGGPASIASVAVGVAVAWGWNWLNSINRTNMLNCFNNMEQTGEYMKVQFMWSSNMVNKFYTTVSKTTTIPNPFPGTYGNWHTDTYGYLYGY